MSEFQVYSVKAEYWGTREYLSGIERNTTVEYYQILQNTTAEYFCYFAVWNKSGGEPGEHLRFAPTFINISEIQ